MPYANGELRPIQKQGRTTNPPAGIRIYEPEITNYASIAALNFNNCDAPCSFSLYKFTQLTGKKILLYSFDLDAGDIVIDTTGYHLAGLGEKPDPGAVFGDYFWLRPHSGQVNYSIEGLEYEKQTIQPPFGTSGKISVIDKYGQPKIKCCNSGSGYEYDCIDDTITAETNTYYNLKLVGAKDLKFIIVDKTLLTEIDGDYIFDSPSGTITTVSVIMYVDSTIVAPFNRKI